VSGFEGWTTDALLAEAGRAFSALVASAEGWVDATVTAEVGNGSVVATVDGHGRLTGIEVSELACRYADADRLADHLITAIRAAEREAARRRTASVDGVNFAGGPIGRLRPYLSEG
jgi:DNA-binding protein YbaB